MIMNAIRNALRIPIVRMHLLVDGDEGSIAATLQHFVVPARGDLVSYKGREYVVKHRMLTLDLPPGRHVAWQVTAVEVGSKLDCGGAS